MAVRFATFAFGNLSKTLFQLAAASGGVLDAAAGEPLVGRQGGQRALDPGHALRQRVQIATHLRQLGAGTR